MRVAWILCATLVGCGRFGFDAQSPNGDATSHDGAFADAIRFLDDGSACPIGFTSLGTSCYRVVAAAGWVNDEHTCEADGIGAHLVVIDDDTERGLLIPGLGLGARTWIGTSKLATPAYRTVIDTAAYLDLGTQTEPSEDCLSIHGDGLMYLHTCGDQNPFVCEYDGKPAVMSAY